MTRFAVAALLGMTMIACHWGTRPHKFALAKTPSGAHVAVRVAEESTDRVGELYAVDSTGVTIRSGRVVRVVWARLQAMDVDKLGRRYDIRAKEIVTPEKRARLAAVSRFPQGLSGELLKLVLERAGQDSLDVIARADLDSLSRVAALASQRYADRRTAITDGYRRIGADFPGMGEHWVHPMRIGFSDALDAQRPSFLTYVSVAGEPKLLGVGFIVSTDREAVGVALPGWPEEWHEHSGLLVEESGARMAAPKKVGDVRIWVLHVWTSLANADGRHAADNWALPFTRIGVRPPPELDADIGRAFSLISGGDEFLRRTLTDVGLRTHRNAASVDSVIDHARSRVTPGEADAIELRAMWTQLSESLEALLGDSVRPILRPPHIVRSKQTLSHQVHGAHP